jgi:hypothetical protein
VTAADPREELDLDRLTKLEQAATPGRWAVEHVGDFGNKWAVLDVARWRGGPMTNTVSFDTDEATAQFVAALRNAAPDLIAAARELPYVRDQRDRLTEALEATTAERDQLRATVERARALHRRQDIPAHEPLRTKAGEVVAEGSPARSICHHDRMAWPCQTFLTLGGDL